MALHPPTRLGGLLSTLGRRPLRAGHRCTLIAAGLLVAGVVSGCGGGGSTPKVASLGRHATTTTTQAPAVPGQPSPATEYADGLRYAKCMRAHGEPSFPDPQNPGGFSSAELQSLHPSAPQFAAANSACAHLLPNGGQFMPSQIQVFEQRGLALARCMRAHGIVNFPDPGMQANGQATFDFSHVDMGSPQYLKAMSECQ
jgi:hypothetical protein